MHRYLALVWNPADSESASRVAGTRAAVLTAQPWTLAYENNGVLVTHQPLHQRSPSVHHLANFHGVVLGSLFHRTKDAGAAQPAGNLDHCETQRVMESSGRHLVQNYWGTYFAVVYDPPSGTCSLLRDPTANLACFHAKWRDIHIFFSDLGDFEQYVPMPVSVNWTHLSAQLLGGFCPSRDCSLNEIEDIPGGEWTTVSTTAETRKTLWHPAPFCVEDPLEDKEDALRELRSAVTNAVHTLASQYDDILVLLSGGLDSSIVTSCLSQQRPRPHVTCLNFYISGDASAAPTNLVLPGLGPDDLAKIRRTAGSADERKFARTIALGCGFPLLEKERSVFSLHVRQLYNAPPAPRPSSYALLCDEDALECEVATSVRAAACFSGQGGDTVFYATLRAIGALDYAYSHPFGSRHLRHIAATAALSGESVAQILAKMLKHGLFRISLPSPIDPMKRPSLLTDDVIQSVPIDYFHHPWLNGAPRLCPGKRNHVLGVTVSVPLYQNVYHRERIAPSVHPLASQPVVETCLRIPTYVLLADGVSRGLARDAFRDLLPPEIVRRTVKGDGLRFYQDVVRHNMRLIREHLLAGVLVRERLLDRSKLEAYLTEDQPFLTVQPTQIMDYLACEVWLAQVNSFTPRAHEQQCDFADLTGCERNRDPPKGSLTPAHALRFAPPFRARRLTYYRDLR
jgi:asparagine synthase (glutamine-hydrolysing)